MQNQHHDYIFQTNADKSVCSSPLTCPRWWFLSQSCPPSVLLGLALLCWLFSLEPEPPQTLRLHLSGLTLLLQISSVCLGSILPLPPSLSSLGLHPPGQQPSPQGWCCPPSARSASCSVARWDFHFFCTLKLQQGDQSRKLKLPSIQMCCGYTHIF